MTRFLQFGFCIVIIAAFVGCQRDGFVAPENSQYLYLDFGADFTDEGILSVEDIDVLLDALDRATITTENGLMKICIASPQKINVSDRVYRYLQKTVELGDLIQLEDLENTELAPRTRTWSEGEIGQDGIPRYDCVPHCIGWISLRCGYGSYYDIYNAANSYVLTNYGSQGVPYDEMYGVMKNFFGSNVTALLSLSSCNPYGALLVINGGTHAVVYTGTSGSIVTYYDPQAGRYGAVPINSISKAYSVKPK